MNNSKTRTRPLIIAHCSISNVTVLIFDGKTTETYGGTAPSFCIFHKRGLLPLPLWNIHKLRCCTSEGMAEGSCFERMS